MILRNLKVLNRHAAADIFIKKDKIVLPQDYPTAAGAMEWKFTDALAFPGIINSHDHLDFNLFPPFGTGYYNSYTQWGRFILKKYRSEIEKVIKIPVELRTKWGAYKNLLCGVTTVINHGSRLLIKDAPVHVYQQGQCLHSVQFEKLWKLRLNNPLKRKVSCAIHTGEGIDRSCAREIDQLLDWNLLNRSLIGIHGIAMNEKQAQGFTALIWCPASNYFLFNRTAPVDRIKQHIPVLFGTDSTLTAGWNLWDHLRQARNTSLLTGRELLQALTTHAASVWNLDAGTLEAGKDADIVVAKMKGPANEDSFYRLNPEDLLMVVQQGTIRLIDNEYAEQLPERVLKDFSLITINGSFKYVPRELPVLVREIKRYYPGACFPISITR